MTSSTAQLFPDVKGQMEKEFAEVAEMCRQQIGDSNEINQRNEQLKEQILERLKKRQSLKDDMKDMQKYAQVKAEMAKCTAKHDEMVQRFAEQEAMKARRREVLAKIELMAGRSLTLSHESAAPTKC
ncbi:Oidioi.mRNA.OKI2018_I69.PAR.g11555.t1.cds [Oikopleura dioica]|uniref:Oidioi.mRNA.OKI2018_I69.PAR.g11555.t1.cds n=1 Tax=Oikopleura dioica TaxID=34765 RepID=A0ABN7S105_OIKDI|nr:Oidioi.mRNA.OKI2018_I69.PAR.g11555.t1.cds [Oikopleura dioica]